MKHKKIISIILSWAMLLTLVLPTSAYASVTTPDPWDGSIASAYADGTGTEEDPYIIKTPAQLAYMAQQINSGAETDKFYKLLRNLDLNNQEWTPIGVSTANAIHSFKGTFEGEGHVIKNLKVTNPSEYDTQVVGLFGYVDSGSVIRNLGVEGVDITVSGGQVVGGLIGHSGSIQVTNCYVTDAKLTSTFTATPRSIGGMVGGFFGSGAKFENCYVNNATLKSSNSSSLMGGFAGGSGSGNQYKYCYTANINEGTDNNAVMYYFGNSSSENPSTVDNCYVDSEYVIDDGDPDTVVTAHENYDRAIDLVSAMSDKADVQTAFRGIGYFEIDDTDDINNGYPYLDFAEYFDDISDDAWDGISIATAYDSGDGTEASPYEIATPAQLAYLAQQVNDGVDTSNKFFKLTSDIDLGIKEWTPIGYFTGNWDAENNRPFAGTFDGNGHIVTNLKISGDLGDMTQAGLFGRTAKATVKNLGVKNVNISLTINKPSGAIVGNMYGGTLLNCYVIKAEIGNNYGYGSTNAGGMIGVLHDTKEPTNIINCYVKDAVLSSGHNYATLGGLLGGGCAQTITNCYTSNITRAESSSIATLYPVCKYVGTSATNCYTDSVALDNNRTDGLNKYNAEYDLGTKTDKAGIVEGLVTNLEDTVFAADSAVNKGYPYIDYEIANPTPTPSPSPTPTQASSGDVWDGSAAASYESGSGTEADPYIIDTAAQLAYMAQQINAGNDKSSHFKLTADIDLNNHEWTPIGADTSNHLAGSFDGCGHVIKNLKITVSTGGYIGLFGYINSNDTTIKNIGLENVNIDSSSSSSTTCYTASLIGRLQGGTVKNSYVKDATIKGKNNAGGLIGNIRANEQNVIINCYASNVELSSTANYFTLVGLAVPESGSAVTFTNCYTTGITVDKTSGSYSLLYPFTYKSADHTNVTITNCYTDSEGSDSSRGGSYVYNADKALVTKTSKADIIEGLVTNLSDTVYKVNSSTNDGYPYIDYEIASPTPTPTPSPTPTPDVWDGTVATAYAGGSGTADDPYTIANASQLVYLAQQTNNGETTSKKYFKLTADIDLGNQEWTPIGYFNGWGDNKAFAGIFDGDGHIVKNLKITAANTNIQGFYVGLFGYVGGATIKNVGLDGVDINNDKSGYTGGLIGHVYNGVKIENSYVANAVIKGKENVGGLVGCFRASTNTFKNCYVYNAELYSSQGSKVLAGFATAFNNSATVTIDNCYTAKITRADGSSATLYPFVNKQDTVTITATNCYTDATGVGSAYDDSFDVSTKTDKAGVIDGLVTNLSDTVYKVNSSTNDGYPYIDYEIANPEPTPTPTPNPSASPTPSPTPTPVGPTPDPDGWNGVPANDYAYGDGSSENPYLIATAAQLAYARDRINDGTDKTMSFKLVADIDLNNQEWQPIGTAPIFGSEITDSNAFRGTFDGDGHKVTNVKITTDYQFNGFFGYVIGATVRNLGIDGFNMILTSSKAYQRAAMVARPYNNASFKNCYVKNANLLVKTPSQAESGYGQMAGFSSTPRSASTFENCYVYNCVLADGKRAKVAGFLINGSDFKSTITNCYAANVSRSTLDGWYPESNFYPFAAGTGKGGLSVTNCYSNANHVVGTDETAGYNYDASSAYGEEGRDRNYIVQKLVTDLGTDNNPFKSDESINDGYPYLDLSKNLSGDELDVEYDADAIDLSYLPDPVHGTFVLPTDCEKGSTITWKSGNTDSIFLSGDTAIVIPQNDQVEVTLVAAVTKGDAIAIRVFTVNVAKRDSSYVEANLNNVAKTNNGDGTTTLSLSVNYGNVSYDTITFMGVLEDGNGDISDCRSDVITKAAGSLEDGTGKSVTLEITVPTADADNYKLYLWGDSAVAKNISLINNSPSDLLNLTAKAKVKNVTLTWDPCFDDDGDPVIYDIYRDGVWIDSTNKTSYKADGGSSSESHFYAVAPRDSKGNTNETKKTDSYKMINMFFADAEGNDDGIIRAYLDSTSQNNELYATTSTTNVNGVRTRFMTATGYKANGQTTQQHIIGFNTPYNVVSVKDKEVVIEVDWIDQGEDDFTLLYNGSLPLDENGKTVIDSNTYARMVGYTFEKSGNEYGHGNIKTAVIRISNAEFRSSSSMVNCSFGILVPSGMTWGEVAITEIRIIKADLYD